MKSFTVKADSVTTNKFEIMLGHTPLIGINMGLHKLACLNQVYTIMIFTQAHDTDWSL